MHMADALLSPAVGIAMDAASIAAIGVSAAKVKKEILNEKLIPLMGVAGAMVFAGQMVNFTVPLTGSSGHIGGGILLAGLLGGVPAFLSMAAVLIIQCLFFADGGLLALGCNIFNIGVIPCLVVYPLVFKPLLKNGVDYKKLSAASVISVMAGLELGVMGVILQTFFSGITELPPGTFAALMLPIHLAIGLVEGIVTAAVLCFIHNARPEIISAARAGRRMESVPIKKVWITLAVLTLIWGGVFSLFASSRPDGLEWAVGKTTESIPGTTADWETDGGIAESAARIQEETAFLPDYAFASDPENAAGTSVSGLIGALITFGLAGLVGWVISLTKRKKRENNIST